MSLRAPWPGTCSPSGTSPSLSPCHPGTPSRRRFRSPCTNCAGPGGCSSTGGSSVTPRSAWPTASRRSPSIRCPPRWSARPIAGTWQREAAAEFYRARRSDAPLALVMVDIDHFNSVNETAGLTAGDQVLQGIARTVTENLQGTGLVGRFGGEQFAILLPQTGETEARRLAERLRDHIAGEPIAIEDGSHAGFVFRLTVSIGIAVLDRSRRALTELIGAADQALSEAKTTGRNKVCVLPRFAEPG